MDVIADIAHPLPFAVICEMLGIPAEARARFRRWSHDYMTFLSSMPPPPEALARAARSVVEMSEYLGPLAIERRARPGEDLLSALLLAEEQGQILSEEELFANLLLLVLAGHETTTNLIGNGLWALLRSPGELERLRLDPGLWPCAINELLRYESPIRLTAARAGEGFDFNGRQIQKEQFVFLLLAAANRDPDQFADPDRLDVGRKENRHLAFSQGGHFCLGAALARMERGRSPCVRSSSCVLGKGGSSADGDA
jgi:pimeloyl-[acyl-carrier protein] synthase